MEKRILLIVTGGIAAYKSLELVRLLKRQGIAVRAVMTKSAAEFVTPLSMAVMTEDQVYGHMFDLKEESEIGHIQLSRQADLIVVCPATANIVAKMAAGIADDLATTILLATDKPVLAVPAMNVRMWNHRATQRNLRQLRADGVHIMAPDEGAMACGEFGPGRLPEPPAVAEQICAMLGQAFNAALTAGRSPTTVPSAAPRAAQPDFADINHRPLFGKRVLVTAGPTHEAIDPVRYIANRSSGRQGFAIAAAAADLGAEVTLIAGPVHLETPPGVIRINVETALEMQAEVEKALPVDAAIMVAAVADWRAAQAPDQKIKKDGDAIPALVLTENPDILASLATHKHRPKLLIGFAAETEKIVDHAQSKLTKKGCDWIVANDVSGDVMGGENNAFHIVTKDGVDSWPESPKDVIARKLMEKVADALAKG
ncbi:MAG: bifunctional phosphopantothenoylcysteine decarboxylase/phosphopantothenate synthase [Sphingorhabdus sp.]|uniref:bifunctional phosphopantothenoylcysteine decarboxylase/phosphopantothenate synthase n=1 Tax=Sphingorhabdus sp. TaxID=1902408 RepID=UPI00273EF32E|nr:bifunctional phosphopantothenoylcysteine decarboxylase/phosphopantothenate synthase [Sphingorhabdus sp.]MDP4872883.1 bifunctional phosphopantothenoylcysteine decarboxylase/phosphopantothenate synthase [Sphingorhabdus sp.]MDP4928034.1 bifunctional phosphopantothenoylcysteine decarboxylase/phosphopantothenate synthase [Sphingorhabdus sp.]